MNWRAASGCGLATLAFLSGGCGTVWNLRQTAARKVVPEEPPDAPMDRIYGGVRADWSEFKRLKYDPESPYLGPGTFLPPLIDLPFSVIGDTLTLPYTLAWEKGFLGMALINPGSEYAPEVSRWKNVDRSRMPVTKGNPVDAKGSDNGATTRK